ACDVRVPGSPAVSALRCRVRLVRSGEPYVSLSAHRSPSLPRTLVQRHGWWCVALSFAPPRPVAKAGGARSLFVGHRPTQTADLEEQMARGEVRIAVTLACEECKRRNYQTNKSRRNTPDRVELR